MNNEQVKSFRKYLISKIKEYEELKGEAFELREGALYKVYKDETELLEEISKKFDEIEFEEE